MVDEKPLRESQCFVNSNRSSRANVISPEVMSPETLRHAESKSPDWNAWSEQRNNIPSTDVIQLTLILKMTTAQVVETSVTVNNNSPIQDYVHPDDQTQPFES